jgi:D-arabinose 1-dehydrogenase-like Zn-dependent alcohol dehydrogenase
VEVVRGRVHAPAHGIGVSVAVGGFGAAGHDALSLVHALHLAVITLARRADLVSHPAASVYY